MSASTVPTDEHPDLANTAASPAREIHLAAHLVIEDALGVSSLLAVARVRDHSCFAPEVWRKWPAGMPVTHFAARMESATIDLFAGIAAETRAFGPKALTSASVDDLSMGHARVAAISRRPNGRVDDRAVADRLGQLEWMARALVAEHWPAIIAVSDQLRDRGSMTAADVAATIAATLSRTDA